MAASRKCQACGKALPANARSTRKYCSDTCRYHKWLAKKDRVTIPTTLRFQVLRRDRFRCRYCGSGPTVDRVGTPDLRTLFVDHVVPVKSGGALTDEANLVTACSACNQGKGSLMMDPAEVPPLAPDDRAERLQTAIDTALDAMHSSQYVGGLSPDRAWAVIEDALSPFETHHADAPADAE